MTRGMLWVLVLLMGLTLLAGGCGTGRYNCKVTIDDSMKDADGSLPSVEVHIIGVNDTGLPLWSDRSVSDYWRNVSADPEVYVMRFGQGLPNPQMLRKDNEAVWKRWENRGAKYLVILSSMPLGAEDKPGDADLRRVILPLDRKRWSSSTFKGEPDTIRIVVTRSRGLTVLTPPKSEKDASSLW